MSGILVRSILTENIGPEVFAEGNCSLAIKNYVSDNIRIVFQIFCRGMYIRIHAVCVTEVSPIVFGTLHKKYGMILLRVLLNLVISMSCCQSLSSRYPVLCILKFTFFQHNSLGNVAFFVFF